MDYGERWCPSCSNCIEDETHAIFHCRSYTFQRLWYSDLFDEHDSSLRSFLVCNPAHRVAQFLDQCRDVRLHGLQDCELDFLSHEQVDDYESDSS